MAQYSPEAGRPAGSGMAIASMVLGIVGIVLMCIPYVGLPCAILAVILGFVALNKAKAGTGGGRGMAIAGVVLGLIALLLAILVIVGAIAALNFLQQNPELLKKALEEKKV